MVVAPTGVDIVVTFEVGIVDLAFEGGTAAEPEVDIVAALAFEADMDSVSVQGPTAQPEPAPVQFERASLHLLRHMLCCLGLEV